MKLIVGLGNPGPQYTRTRHNAGFMVVDRLVAKHAGGAVAKGRFAASCVDADVAGARCVLIKPTTFMNLSGQSVGQAVSFYKIDPAQELLVVVDDLYLPVGSIRLRPSGGDGGHNGLSDIQRALGGEIYPRLRIGVGDRPNGGKPGHIEQKDYVLSRFIADEEPDLDLALSASVEAVETFVAKGLPAAMNKFNKKESKGT